MRKKLASVKKMMSANRLNTIHKLEGVGLVFNAKMILRWDALPAEMALMERYSDEMLKDPLSLIFPRNANVEYRGSIPKTDMPSTLEVLCASGGARGYEDSGLKFKGAHVFLPSKPFGVPMLLSEMDLDVVQPVGEVYRVLGTDFPMATDCPGEHWSWAVSGFSDETLQEAVDAAERVVWFNKTKEA